MSTQSDPLKVTAQELQPDYVIAGDSWGCGEWALPDQNSRLTHAGLEYFLTVAGLSVINISQGGSTLLGILDQLRHYGASNGRTSQSKWLRCFVFQTEWYRNYVNMLPYCFTDEPLFFRFDRDIIQKVISKWQYQLVALAERYRLKIYLIGGASDTIWLSNFEKAYPNLTVACQSMTNLCLENDDRIERPVFTMAWNADMLKYCKKSAITDDDLEFLIAQVDLAEKRRFQWARHPEWFGPDGQHGNRHAHRKLFDLLKDKRII